jgi:flagellar basal body P-ring formation protein FlgA
MRWICCSIAVLLIVASAGAATTVSIRQDTLRQVIESYITAKASGTGVRAEIKRLGGLTDQQLPAGEIVYEVIAPQQWEGWGKTSLALVIRVNDQVVRNLPLQVDVAGWRDILIAARPMERGEVLRPQDVALERRDMATVRGIPLLSPDEVTGKRLRNAIRQGAVLHANGLEKVMLITAGQQVTIMLESDVLRLTATGKTKGAGALGDMILVQNTASQKEFPAKIVDAQTVRVDF